MNNLLDFRVFLGYIFISIRDYRVMQSFGLRTHKKHMTKIDRIPMPYIEPNVANGTEALKLKKWLERFHNALKGVMKKT